MRKKKKQRPSRLNCVRFSKSHKKKNKKKTYKNLNIEYFDRLIFAIRSCMPTRAIEVLKRNTYGRKQC